MALFLSEAVYEVVILCTQLPSMRTVAEPLTIAREILFFALIIAAFSSVLKRGQQQRPDGFGWAAIVLLGAAIICHIARRLFIGTFRAQIVKGVEIIEVVRRYDHANQLFITAELLVLLAALTLLFFSKSKGKRAEGDLR